MIGVVGLAHSSMQGKSTQGQAADAVFLFIRWVLLAIFVAAFVVGGLPKALDFYTWPASRGDAQQRAALPT